MSPSAPPARSGARKYRRVCRPRGFTRLGEAVPPEELQNLASRLSNLAHDVVAPPVRFIETIGDAVMFVSADPVALCGRRWHSSPPRRSTTTFRDSDWPRVRVRGQPSRRLVRQPVNMASRVTGVARPGPCWSPNPPATRSRRPTGRWSFAGARHLKGVKGEVKLFRARAANEDKFRRCGHRHRCRGVGPARRPRKRGAREDARS